MLNCCTSFSRFPIINSCITFCSADKSNSGGESLSKLVSLCFGRCLNKSDQFSNWEQRPLRVGQKRYAGKLFLSLIIMFHDHFFFLSFVLKRPIVFQLWMLSAC